MTIKPFCEEDEALLKNALDLLVFFETQEERPVGNLNKIVFFFGKDHLRTTLDSISAFRTLRTPCLDKDLVVSLVRLYSLFLTAPTIIANKYCQWNRGECFWNNYDYEQYSGSESEPITLVFHIERICSRW